MFLNNGRSPLSTLENFAILTLNVRGTKTMIGFEMRQGMKLSVVSSLVVAASLMGLAAYNGAEAASPQQASTEVRIGSFYHGYASAETGTADIAVDVLLPAFDLGKTLQSDVFSLHPQFGADLNLQGKTSAVFLGFAGVANLPGNFVIEANLGGSVNNGNKTSPADSGRSELGCTTLFREAFGIGYRFSKQISLMAVAEHMSNANLCTPNNGITNFGLRLGYSF